MDTTSENLRGWVGPNLRSDDPTSENLGGGVLTPVPPPPTGSAHEHYYLFIWNDLKIVLSKIVINSSFF
jgi:hypothetical protein